MQQAIEGGAAALGITLDDRARERLVRLLVELIEWNGRFNLTAIRDPEDMIRKHLLDSLTLHALLHGDRIADVGTGAGFPGLPLAVVNPSKHFTLIDSIQKKTRFVAHAADALGLTNVEVVTSRAEAYKPAVRFDTVVARALSKIADFIGYAGHLVAPGGRMLAMKGQYPALELDALPKGWEVRKVHRVEVPGLEAERHIVELQRVAR